MVNFSRMDIETLYEYCMSKPGVEETFPFGEQTLVFKVMGKMFALTNLEDEDFKVNLKCEPTYAEELREKYPEVQPGFHMNKKHWNTISFQGGMEEKTLRHLINHSYELVVSKLKKTDREFLKSLSEKPDTNV